MRKTFSARREFISIFGKLQTGERESAGDVRERESGEMRRSKESEARGIVCL
jgi:hypothetical protein